MAPVLPRVQNALAHGFASCDRPYFDSSAGDFIFYTGYVSMVLAVESWCVRTQCFHDIWRRGSKIAAYTRHCRTKVMAVVYMMEPQYSRVTAFWNYEQLIFVKTACFVLVSHIYIYIYTRIFIPGPYWELPFLDLCYVVSYSFLTLHTLLWFLSSCVIAGWLYWTQNHLLTELLPILSRWHVICLTWQRCVYVDDVN